jgi:hypothetical protein
MVHNPPGTVFTRLLRRKAKQVLAKHREHKH